MAPNVAERDPLAPSFPLLFRSLPGIKMPGSERGCRADPLHIYLNISPSDLLPSSPQWIS
jgi:hypothetical protein